MRRLTLEIFGASFERIKAASPYWNVKALEILHMLRSSKEEIASICRLEIAGSIPAGKNFLIGKKGIFSSFRAQILEREKSGAFIVYATGKPRLDVFPMNLIPPGGYVVSPLEFRDDRARMTFLGNASQVSSLLHGLQKQKVQHKVLDLTDAKFSPDSPLRGLTQKQLLAIRSAFELGYFDIPRRVSFEELGEKLRLDPSTLNIHLRKAQKKILSKMFSNQ
ncbi:MAG: helix-turn-helix domain-containing protein [Nitrososphaerales archaeon]